MFKISPNNRSRRFTRSIPAIAALWVIGIFISGCVKNEFRMLFDLPASVNNTYRLTYYASDPRGGLQVETAVAVAAGKGDVKGITRYPTLVTLSSGSSDLPALIFYAERGDKITLSGTDADPVKWKVDGNDINRRLTEWRLDNVAAIEAARRVSDSGRDSVPRIRLNSLVASYAEANKDSRTAPLLVFSYFDASLQPAEFARLWHMLEESGNTADLSRLLARNDMLTATPALFDMKKMKLKDMVVQSRDHNIDTLRIGTGGSPVLIWYWCKDDPDRKQTVDSLRRILKWRPDSASMIVADIALMSDSAQWSYTSRQDSLTGAVRAFAPRGLADPAIMTSGVRATPWFVVAAGKGKQAYSGEDLDKALAAFRKLKPKKP